MKSRGILMSGPMVCAWLAGLKWQTRRLNGLKKINENPDEWKLGELLTYGAWFTRIANEEHHFYAKFPYGKVGDELWFRETFQVIEPWGSDGDEWIGDDIMEIDGKLPKEKPEQIGCWWSIVYKATDDICSWWRSPIFMPRWASRISTKVTGVRMERLHDISADDAFAEGIRGTFLNQRPDWMDIDQYRELWNQINGKIMSWEKNPWVWVYEFEKNPSPTPQAIVDFPQTQRLHSAEGERLQHGHQN